MRFKYILILLLDAVAGGVTVLMIVLKKKIICV